MTSGQRAKNLLKRGIRRGARSVGPLLYAAHHPTSRILTYHSIGYRRYEMNVTPEDFAAQMAWLTTHHRVISLAQAAQGVPGVAVSFDDGYQDNLVNAVPILQKYHIPATIFVVSGHLGACLPLEREPETGRLLTASELLEVRRLEVEIGGHTVTHPRLARLTPEEQAVEIGACKKTLEDILGETVSAFAYPYGSALDFGRTAETLAARSGYDFACSNQYGHNTPARNPWALRRIWIDSTDTLESFQDKVTGRLDAMAWQDSRPGIHLRTSLNRWLKTT